MDHVKQKIGVGKITLICDRCRAQKEVDTNRLSRTLIDKELKFFGEDHKHTSRDK